MNPVKTRAYAALLLASIAFAAPLRASDEKATPEQLQELRAALTEGIAQQDAKMMDLAVKGFGAAGQKGAVLEESIKTAEYEAAIQMLQPFQRAQLEMWALYTSAKGGNKEALQKIVAAAGFKIEGDVKTLAKEPAKFQKLSLDLNRATIAMKALGMLKYEGAVHLARVWLSGGNGNFGEAAFLNTDGLVKACADCIVSADREAGLKELEGYVADAKVPFATRTAICRVMTQGTWTGAAMEQPPEDIKKRFGEKISVLVDAMDQNTDGQTASGLLNTAMQLKLGAEVIKKFEDFANTKANDNAKQTIQMYLRYHQQTQAAKPVKPQPPPKENGEF